jgi:dTDP-4-dehydrorhamnose reductase
MAEDNNRTQSERGETRSAMITGGDGLLARFMLEQLKSSGWRAVALTHAELDVTSREQTLRRVEQTRPDFVINCATTGDVDRCERDTEWAYAVNENGPGLLSRACREFGAQMVHTSTDYVFDGAKQGFYTQEDEPNPLSVYGKSKLAGERAVVEEAEKFFIIRTSWLFGEGGKNFGSRLFEYASRSPRLKGVSDQTSIPTYAPDLAARIEHIINLNAHGLYQVTNTGVATWFEFAQLALETAGIDDVEIEPVTRASLAQAAPRPQNSAMRCLLSEKLGLAPLRHWRDAVVDFAPARKMTNEP